LSIRNSELNRRFRINSDQSSIPILTPLKFCLKYVLNLLNVVCRIYDRNGGLWSVRPCKTSRWNPSIIKSSEGNRTQNCRFARTECYIIPCIYRWRTKDIYLVGFSIGKAAIPSNGKTYRIIPWLIPKHRYRTDSTSIGNC